MRGRAASAPRHPGSGKAQLGTAGWYPAAGSSALRAAQTWPPNQVVTASRATACHPEAEAPVLLMPCPYVGELQAPSYTSRPAPRSFGPASPTFSQRLARRRELSCDRILRKVLWSLVDHRRARIHCRPSFPGIAIAISRRVPSDETLELVPLCLPAVSLIFLSVPA
ncbi:hypothetical protein BDY21DRAFT_215772 [Lineolata rhizophorae]|uniref:Uncharacterized protein n=1 Tax=Lineolata rhizophorae TaxID=578093 RepID=A0A6A6P345_9PEZI|nr:hypothetical protein BDY21DRAFT_215772 [Lineolata rhizophorae]